ncbi:aldehyde:ferredoxin oxidoreductase [Bradyrhizobium sp. USDA 3240]
MVHIRHQVSPERLEELRRIYKEISGDEITTEEAREMAHRLLTVYRLISRPLPGEIEKTASGPSPAQSALEEV